VSGGKGGRLLCIKMNYVAKEWEMEDNKVTREWMEGAEGEEKSRRGHSRGGRVGKEGAAPREREERREAATSLAVQTLRLKLKFRFRIPPWFKAERTRTVLYVCLLYNTYRYSTLKKLLSFSVDYSTELGYCTVVDKSTISPLPR